MPSARIKEGADLSDPMQVAIEVTAIKGSLAMMQQQVSTGLGNVSSRLDSMQADQRETTKILGDVARQQHDLQAHSEGLDRLARAIDRSTSEFALWRDKHEGENQKVSDRITGFRGAMVGFGLVAAMVAGLAGMYVSTEFGNVRRETENRFSDIQGERARIERKHDIDVDKIEKDIHEIKKTMGVR